MVVLPKIIVVEIEYDQLQAGVLKPTGRNHRAMVFLSFEKKNRSRIRTWISSLQVTSAADQQVQTERYRLGFTEPVSVMNFFLSKDGYDTLGLSENSRHGAFETSMSAQADGGVRNALNDDLDCWEKEYKMRIDAMYMISNDNVRFWKCVQYSEDFQMYTISV